MALGWSYISGGAIMAAACGGAPFGITNHWIQLHSGDPGQMGTANVANGGKRTLVTFDAGSGLSDSEETWTNWEGGVPTHWTSWSAETGGTFQLSGLASVDAPSLGATLTVAPGGISLVQVVAT